MKYYLTRWNKQGLVSKQHFCVYELDSMRQWARVLTGDYQNEEGDYFCISYEHTKPAEVTLQ